MLFRLERAGHSVGGGTHAQIHAHPCACDRPVQAHRRPVRVRDEGRAVAAVDIGRPLVADALRRPVLEHMDEAVVAMAAVRQREGERRDVIAGQRADAELWQLGAESGRGEAEQLEGVAGASHRGERADAAAEGKLQGQRSGAAILRDGLRRVGRLAASQVRRAEEACEDDAGGESGDPGVHGYTFP